MDDFRLCQVDIKQPARPPHWEVDVFTTLFSEVAVSVCQTHPGGIEGSRSHLRLESMPCVDAHLRSPSPSKLPLFSVANCASLQHVCCNGPSSLRCSESLLDPDKQGFSSATLFFNVGFYTWQPVSLAWPSECVLVSECAWVFSYTVCILVGVPHSGSETPSLSTHFLADGSRPLGHSLSY